MCTQPLKCYKLSKKLLRDYVEKHHLYNLECINDLSAEEILYTAKARAITYYTNKIFYQKEDGKYKLKRILWRREPKNFAECYVLSEINCGHCQECTFKRAGDWALRCELETKYHTDNCFITLTYNNENLPANRSLKMADLQKFWKRLRRYIARQGEKDGKKETGIKYFACGEYG